MTQSNLSNEQVAELYNLVEQLKQENRKLKDAAFISAGKEKELRDLISYLNKLGPQPVNMNP